MDQRLRQLAREDPVRAFQGRFNSFWDGTWKMWQEFAQEGVREQYPFTWVFRWCEGVWEVVNDVTRFSAQLIANDAVLVPTAHGQRWIEEESRIHYDNWDKICDSMPLTFYPPKAGDHKMRAKPPLVYPPFEVAVVCRVGDVLYEWAKDGGLGPVVRLEPVEAKMVT